MSCNDQYPCTTSSHPFCYMEQGQTEGICLPGEPGKLLTELYNSLASTPNMDTANRPSRDVYEDGTVLEKRMAPFDSPMAEEYSDRGAWPQARSRPVQAYGGEVEHLPPVDYVKRDLDYHPSGQLDMGSRESDKVIESILERLTNTYKEGRD
ncbi:hypothetical protein EMCRGX_G000732 [Ephydatia muelleri]|eukprot:Em0001g571a